MLLRKIDEYEKRSIEIQKLIIVASPVTEEERLMAATISAINLQHTTNQLFPTLAYPNTMSTDPRDILMQERIAKLSARQSTPHHEQSNIEERIAKLAPGSYTTNNTSSPTIDAPELTEQEQIEKILNEATDAVHLDILSGGYHTKSEANDETYKRHLDSGIRTHKTTQKKTQKHIRKKEKEKSDSSDTSSEEYSSSSASDSSSEGDGNTLKQREKDEIRKMSEDERARKKLAYQKFRKNQFY